MNTGLFITFEGADGLGKSKQADMLRWELEGRGHRVYFTKEPGTKFGTGSPLGAVVREAVFHLEDSGRTLPAGARSSSTCCWTTSTTYRAWSRTCAPATPWCATAIRIPPSLTPPSTTLPRPSRF